MKYSVRLLCIALALAPAARAQCLNETGTLTPQGSLDPTYGYSTDVSGDRAIVGAHLQDVGAKDSGAAYLFERQGAVWVEITQLSAADGAEADQFGWDVALSGGTAIVGAYTDDDGGFQAGSAYVFELQGTDWVEVAELIASDSHAHQRFGYSVDVEGDVAVVGASQDNEFGGNAGAAYVFERQGTTWTQVQKLTSAGLDSGDFFGVSVALSGDRIVIGAWGDDDVPLESGAAYVFEKQGTQWIETAKLTASDPLSQTYFGGAVAVEGSTVVVSRRHFIQPLTSGPVYVFELQGTTWIESARLLGHDSEMSDRFGEALSLSQDHLLIGAPGDNDPPLPPGAGPYGSTYLFERQGSSWVEAAKHTSSPASAATEQWGRSVALDGAVGIVGGYRAAFAVQGAGAFCPPLVGFPATISLETGGTQELFLDAGPDHAASLYWLLGSDSGTSPGIPLPPTPYVLPLNNSAYFLDTLFGPNAVVQNSLSFLDDEGRAVASLTLPGGLHPNLAGVVLHHAYILLDPVTLIATSVSNATQVTLAPYPPEPTTCYLTEDQILTSSDPGATFKFGNSSSVSGDLLLVGDPDYESPQGVDRGAAFLYQRQGVAWTEVLKLEPSIAGPSSGFGYEVFLTPDQALVLDLVTSIFSDNRAFLFERQGTNWVETHVFQVPGAALSPALYVGGDEVLIGGSKQGVVYDFRRQAGVWSSAGTITGSDTVGGSNGDYFGNDFVRQGDVLLVGAPSAGGRGKAYIFERQGADWVEVFDIENPKAGIQAYSFGFAVALSGSTALIGAATDQPPGSGDGAGYLYEQQGTDWIPAGRLDLPAPELDRDLRDLALAGSHAVLGVAEGGFVSKPGSLIVYERQGTDWLPTVEFSATDAATIGRDISISGDTVVTGKYVFSGFSQVSGGCPPLLGKPPGISVTTGGTQSLVIEAGGMNAYDTYLVLGTIAGSSPGLPLPPTSFTLPLNFSNYLLTTLTAPNTVIANSFGQLDAYGDGMASLSLPGGLDPALIGFSLHHAYVVYESGTTDLNFVSNAAALTFVP